MIPVVLETRGGALVAKVTIPPFQTNPPCDVLVWGGRFFKAHEDRGTGGWTYRECFAFFVQPSLDERIGG